MNKDWIDELLSRFNDNEIKRITIIIESNDGYIDSFDSDYKLSIYGQSNDNRYESLLSLENNKKFFNDED